METFLGYILDEGSPAYTVSLADVKAHLTIEHDDEDTRLISVLETAIETTERECNLSAMPSNWKQVISHLFGKHYINHPPLDELEIKYYEDGVLTTLNPTEYYVMKGTSSSYIEPKTCWPEVDCRPDAVQITYSTAPNVSATLRLAILLLCAHYNEDREGTKDIPEGVMRLWNTLRNNRGTI